MILSGPIFAGDDSVQYFDNGAGFHDQTSFFQSFALDGGAEGLAQFHHSSGQRPLSGSWRVPTPGQQHTILFNNDRSHTDYGPVRIFALHYFLPLREP